MQRERDCERYQDAGANLHVRPSLWVEPEGDWGEGEVRLVEIPTEAETTTTSRPSGSRAGRPKRRAAGISLPSLGAGGEQSLAARPDRADPGRCGIEPAQAAAHRRRVRRRRALLAEAGTTGHIRVALSNAKGLRTHVEALPWKRRWRMVIDVEPDGRRPVDLRADLGLRGETLAETWTDVFRP